jgi:hypothetical protein
MAFKSLFSLTDQQGLAFIHSPAETVGADALCGLLQHRLK